MILSVSRRTDIPNYYSDWFFERLKEGYLYVKNPMNPHQISKIILLPEFIDCIVFWTKNPEPMLERLEVLKQYAYYFQFTLTGYGSDIEPGLPDKRKNLIPTFQELSRRIGKEKVIWRYDPILINNKYTPSYHEKAFREIARSLEGYTDKVIISFIDMYEKTKRNAKDLGIQELNQEEMLRIASKCSEIAREYGYNIESCAEQLNLESCNIKHGSCIDKAKIEQITGTKLNGRKDKNQRAECGCLESIEVGTYDTCRNGCKYCYANRNTRKVGDISLQYNPYSPILCGTITSEDKITERKIQSLKVK